VNDWGAPGPDPQRRLVNELPKGQDGKLPGVAGSGSLPVPGRPTMPPARSDTDLEAGAGIKTMGSCRSASGR
jgi:hypothetical protein